MRTLARAHLANGEPALAEENLRNAIEAAPKDVMVRVELAQILMQTGRTESAITLLEEAVKSAPTHVPARESLARAYLAKEDFEAARRSAEDLKILAPDKAVGYYLAGVVAQSQNRLDDAQKDLERALELQPTAVDTLAALTRMDLSKGRDAVAIARVQKAIDADSNNVAARNLLGEIYLAQKKYPDAISQLEKAVSTAGQWSLPYRNLALARIASGDAAGGIKTYENALAPTNYAPSLVTDLAALYERQNRVEDAIKQYEVLYSRNPGYELAANNLAMLLVTYKSDRPSLDRAQTLTAKFAESTNPALLDTHGWVRFKSGAFTEALPTLERAVERAPQSKVIRYHLAMAQAKAGQRDKARSNLEAALAGAAPFAGIDEARTLLEQLKGQAG
jgi:tetratricopeptide (TPR) repeat protein